MRKYYTDEELLDELRRFYEENGRSPKAKDMNNTNGYISKRQYIDRFGSWNNALNIAKLTLNVHSNYTKNEALYAIKNFYNIYNRVPTSIDTRSTLLPSIDVYLRLFSSWNSALELAGFEINKTQIKLMGDEECDICHTTKTHHWNNVDNLRICDKCSRSKRDFIHGILDPDSTTGFGYISEYIIHQVLGGTWMNQNIDSFNTDYDIYNNIYKNINVKSSTLHIDKKCNYESWQFCISYVNKIPDNYILIGFDENKTKILHVWIIPSIDKISKKFTIRITHSNDGLNKYKKYEIDIKQFNDVYTNLEITNLFPFRNLNKTKKVLV